MPFSAEIRRDSLVGAARHCCVCHRYKGVKVEVHHIIPESKGGSNDIENAIVLCFDCHADAGHYNPQHPRGTKFSPDELRKARNEWHSIVQTNKIEQPDQEDIIYCRYLLCKDFTQIIEICNGNLSSMPIQKPFLSNNQISTFQKSIVERYSDGNRKDVLRGDSFHNAEAYSKVYPDARIIGLSKHHHYPYFRAFRIPTNEEMSTLISSEDPLCDMLLNTGVPKSEICQVMAYEEECGDLEGFQEIFYLRPFWALYLEVCNISNRPLRVRSARGQIDENNTINFRAFQNNKGEEGEILLPASPIFKEQSALIPLASLLGPLDKNLPEGISQNYIDLDTGQVQKIEHSNLTSIVQSTALIGPAIWPKILEIDLNEKTIMHSIHEFDLSNLYTIGRFWEAGCCPYIFIITDKFEIVYMGEIFPKHPFNLQVEKIIMPPRAKKCIVAELEAERTWIDEIFINGELIVKNCGLQQDDTLSLKVDEGDEVIFQGRYEPNNYSANRSPNPLFKNTLIYQFMSRFE